MDFQKELKAVCKNCGRRAEEVKVVYATKYLTADQFVRFLNVGREIGILPVTIGENRVQEAEKKMQRLKDKDRELIRSFHLVMIGNLQKNKINKAIRIFSEIQAVDSLELAYAIDKRVKKDKGNKRVMEIFLEVNVSDEESKHGFGVEEIERAIAEIRQLKAIKVKGLMTMAPWVDDSQETRPIFRKLKQIADRYRLLTSMGMSSDWRVAVEEGSDMIRIGRRIFRGLPGVQSYFTPDV